MMTIPKCNLEQMAQQDLDAFVDAYNNQALMIERVRELHKPMKETNKNGFVNILCEGCPDDNVNWGTTFYADYPCPTIKALNGDQS